MTGLSDIQAMKALKLANQNTKYIGNLFNPATISVGQYLNGGNLSANASYGTSDFMSVTPNTQYIIKDVRFVSQYDASKNFIGGTNLVYSPSRQNLMIRSNSSASFIRVSSAIATMQSGDYYFAPVKNPSKWVAKVWGALGDSITQYAMWQPYVESALGVVHYNYGSAGTKVADTTGSDTTAMCRDERINAITSSASLVTVMGGTNDWSQAVPLGSITDAVTTSYYGALNTMIQKLVTRFPTSRIVLITPPFGIQPNKAGWTDTTGLKNNINLTPADYGNAMIQIARLYGIPVIDSYGNCGWNQFNYTNYLNNETYFLHPNDAGGQRLAEVVSGHLKRIEPTV